VKCIVFAVIILLGVIGLAEAGMDEADEAYKRGEYALAYREFLHLAEDGDAFSQFRIGSMHMQGFGVQQNDTEAVKWFGLAAEQGQVNAQFNLGTFFEDGIGVSKNDAMAAKWYLRAAKQGDLYSQTNLAILYSEGRGVSQDDAIAVTWLYKAASNNHPNAQALLAMHYANGTGVSQDFVRSYMWAELAAAQGLDAAINMKAKLEQDFPPELISEGLEMARRWDPKEPIIVTDIRQQDDGTVIQLQRIVDLEDDGDLSMSAFKQGDYAASLKAGLRDAQNGSAHAQDMVANYYYLGLGVDQDLNEAVKWWRKAAEQGYRHAQYWMGILHSKGDGVPLDHDKAVEWYLKAAEQGSPGAQYNLGIILARGDSVSKDLVQAYVWFALAAQGYQEGIDEGFDGENLREDAEQSREYVDSLLGWLERRRAKKLAREWKPTRHVDQ